MPNSTTQDRHTGEEHYARANNLAKLKPEEAAREYKLAIENNYDTVELRIQLGRLLTQLKRPAEATEHLRIATQRAKKNWRAHWSLALSLLEAEQFREALVEYNTSRKIDPKLDGLYNYYIGRCLEGMGHYQDALVNYQEFLKHEESISSNAPEIPEVNERIRVIKGKIIQQ
jgi:tetratricopeptide (TPR) repeat protein